MGNKNFGQLNAQEFLSDMMKELSDVKKELREEGQEAGEAIGQGWDEGINDTVERIKASSIKTDKAFKNLSEKIKKQVQQLSTNIGGKDTKIKIDFSDIDMNSDDIKKQIEKKIKSIKVDDVIDFDTKGFDNQLTNFVTLFVKYQEKLKSLKQVYPNISVPKDAINNLQQQLALTTELKQMHKLLNQPIALQTMANPMLILKDLSKLQQFTDSTKSQSFGEYDKLAEVLSKIQSSLQIISDTFQNENNSMKVMAEGGVTSFTSLSQAIIEVYNNLTQVQSLVDTISQKDFNITNITQTGGGSSNLQAMTQQMAVARETMEHLRQLYDQAGDTMQLLANKGQVDLVFEHQKQLQELDMTAIGKSVKGANTEMKLASVLAEMQDYIDKLIQINQLRNKFDLGGWKDSFVPTKKPVVKPTVQQQTQSTSTPIVTQPQTTSTSNTETQQMWQLKAAIDEVSNAIGRKNAGFIKEQEIVNTSVEAEKAKLKELVGVITNEIGLALDDIKSKFAQSFIVPELDKNDLQSSFDEIYNKFIELKDKIGIMKIDVGVDGASDSKQAIDGESQETVDVAKQFVEAANAKLKFVEANKQVADSAKESAKAVEEESKAAEQAKQTMTAVADDTVQPSNWDKISQLQTDHGEDPFALSRSKTENVGDKSVRTIVESWGAIKDEDGNLTGEMELNTVKIINDFKKRTDAVTKENEKIKTAQAYLQKFLTQFDNKTMGKGSLLAGYQDLVGLANSPDFKIDDIAKAEQMMSNLDAEYNKVVQSMRKGSSSMNPFVNAINGMDKMEDVLRSLSLQFKTLNQQPDWLNNDIVGLYKQLDSLAVETDIYKFAEGFGNLKVSINSVTESIRQQRVEQKLTLSDFNDLVKATKTRDTNTEKAAKEEDGSVWKTYYLDRAAEQQKVIDTIRIGLTLTEEQESQLNAMAEKHALILGDITRENNKIEEQKQKYEEIMRLLEKNRADQIELDNDKTLDTADRSEYQQILNQERAEIEKLIANTDLNPEQKKSVNTSLGSIENDRIAKVKEYIDLLKLQQDYERKAAKEDDGSKMQSFYNEQIAKVKNKIKQIDITAIENQDEKNKRLAIEEAHQRAIAEIEAKKNASEKKSMLPLGAEEERIQKKYESGYLSNNLYNDWRKELSEYRNYKTGATQADEDTIKNKKQSLMQLYDTLTKVSNASKSFFTSGGEILPEEMWLNENEMKDMSGSLRNLYENIVAERFEGMTTSVTRVQGELGKLTFTVDNGAGSLSQYTIKTNQATGATKLLADSTKPALTVLQRFGQTLKKDFTGLLTAVMGGTSIHTFVQYMRQGIQSVRELDLALTELKKVTDATEETYDKFLDTASKTSARIGKTITEMTSATAEFAKLGYDIELASSMAESALVYANVGDNVDVETGSQSIISTMKAFGVETNNTMSIVDKFNEVGELIAHR